MKRKLAEQFAKNEANNAVFANMLNENLAELKKNDKSIINEKFDLTQVGTLSKTEVKRILSEY